MASLTFSFSKDIDKPPKMLAVAKEMCIDDCIHTASLSRTFS